MMKMLNLTNGETIMKKTKIVRPIHIILWMLDVGLVGGICYGLYHLLLWMGMMATMAGPISIIIFTTLLVMYKIQVGMVLEGWRKQLDQMKDQSSKEM
jgi:hypothetical protein